MTTYRFLPWTRRGLAAALPDGAADNAELKQRPEVAVKVVVTGAGDASNAAVLHGPGDVVGLDLAQIIRTYPRANTTDAEPNYLAAVDFDAPELPWIFTPRGVPGSGKLPPWLVLVVVEERAGVEVTLPKGAPLPQLKIAGGAAGELPNLADSWAWAHVQLVETDGADASTGRVSANLETAPDHNVSRLLCPRRLIAERRWIAAVVPAYDAGRIRGLGGTPPADAPLKPAWTPDQDTVTLPAYYYWEFQTGLEGDFESLAQRIRPHKAAETVGQVQMHVGEGAPPIRVPMAPDPTQRRLKMDGALRAPIQQDGTLEQVPATLRSGLKEVARTLADAADGVLDGQILVDASRQPVGPPIYASSHVQRWRVLDQEVPQDAEWFRELNLDPRPRVAAGLGTECVRVNQEDIVNAAWRQVGDVMAAQAALQRAALSKLVSMSFFTRHVNPMPDHTLVSMAGPVADRTPLAGFSLTATISTSSLPDAVIDAGLRRALAPAGRAVARAARRIGIPTAEVRPGLVSSLAAGRADLDATRFDRPAITGVAPEMLSGTTLAGIGLTLEVGEAAVTALAASASALVAMAGQPAGRTSVRADIREIGLLSQAHIDAARKLSIDTRAALQGEVAAEGTALDVGTVATMATGSLLDDFVGAAVEARRLAPDGGDGVGFLVEGPFVQEAGVGIDLARPAVTVGVLDVEADHTLVVRAAAGQADEPIAVLDESLGGLGGIDLGTVLTRIDSGTLGRAEPGVPVDRTKLPRVDPNSRVLDPAGDVVVGRLHPIGGPFIHRLGGNPVGHAGAGHGPVVAGPVEHGQAGHVPVVEVPVEHGPFHAGPVELGGVVAGPVEHGQAGHVPVVEVPVEHGPFHAGPVEPGGVVAAGGAAVAGGAVAGGPADPGAARTGRISVLMPPLVHDDAAIGRYENALAQQVVHTAIELPAPLATLVPYDLAIASSAVKTHVNPAIAQPLRRDALVAFGGKSVDIWRRIGEQITVDGWWSTHALDRIMAYPTFPLAASGYLAKYDRTRFCPGVDTIPPDSVTLLETNPRFIASFMAGLNHETNRELLWRGYPTDSRGTPFRHFWQRLDGKKDIPPIHGWRLGTLAEQTTDPKGNLVLLVRGDLLRRYPNTIVVATKAIDDRTPDKTQVKHPIFHGHLDPDITYYGFELIDTQLKETPGWFFALMEPVTEPRFGLDETVNGRNHGHDDPEDSLNWPDSGVAAGHHLGLADFDKVLLNNNSRSDDVAKTLFQKPFALYVNAKHLVNIDSLPAQH